LRETGFEYAKKGNKAIIIERADIVMWRHDYLVAMKRCRNKGINVFYTDESWVNTGTTVAKVWKDKTLQTPRQAFLAGLSTGLKPPTARGPRCALVHTGNENGFLPNTQLVLLCEKNTADAHDEMDGEIYERYFKDQFLLNLPQSSVIVLDNAFYHSRKIETVPTVSWRKGKFQEWITSHGQTFEEYMLKKHFLETVSRVRPKYDKCKIDEMASVPSTQYIVHR
jgi:hypothetical protein